MFGRKYPMFLYLLRPSCSSDSAKLSVRKLLFLLKAELSEGSNSRPYENAVYTMFFKYVREASSGRRVVTLENILEFVTGVSDEPPPPPPLVLEWVQTLSLWNLQSTKQSLHRKR